MFSHSHLIKAGFICLATVLIAGCTTKLPADALERTHTVVFVPLDAPRFDVPDADHPSFTGGYAAPPVMPIFLFTFLDLIWAEHKYRAENRDRETKRIRAIVANLPPPPAHKFAEFGAELLNASGRFSATARTMTSASSSAQPDKSTGDVNERPDEDAWYHSESSPFDRDAASDTGADMMIETTIGRFQAIDGCIGIQMYVYAKVIDPITGRTIGRARTQVTAPTVDTFHLLGKIEPRPKGWTSNRSHDLEAPPLRGSARGAVTFDEIVTRLGKEGTRKNLVKLGLLSEASKDK